MRSLILQLGFLTLAAVLPVAAADVFLGTWKLDPAKSKYDPGPGPKSSTNVLSADGDWIVVKGEGVNADGKPTSNSNRYKRDGKDYPWATPLYPGNVTISVKLTDDHHSIGTQKRDGSILSTSKITISKDGKTRTMVSTGTDASGKKFSNTAVYNRQ